MFEKKKEFDKILAHKWNNKDRLCSSAMFVIQSKSTSIYYTLVIQCGKCIAVLSTSLPLSLILMFKNLVQFSLYLHLLLIHHHKSKAIPAEAWTGPRGSRG
jgi:hypothetical protein